jgi:hypothetical protein
VEHMLQLAGFDERCKDSDDQTGNQKYERIVGRRLPVLGAGDELRTTQLRHLQEESRLMPAGAR